MDIVILISAGVIAGVLGGLLGLGGGFIFLPTLYLILNKSTIAHSQLVPIIIASSLMGVFCNSIVSSLSHHKKKGIDYSEAKRMLPFILTGSLCGSWAVLRIPASFLISFYSIFILVVGGRMLIGELKAAKKKTRTAQSEREKLSEAVRVPPQVIGTGIGFFSTLLGIGGGTFSVPYFHWIRKLEMKKAVGTSALCGAAIALFSLIGFSLQQGHFQVSSPYLLGFFYLPAGYMIGASLLSVPLGVRWCHRWKPTYIRILFGCLLSFLGVRMLM